MSPELPHVFTTKKAANDAGYRSKKKWFSAFYVPKHGAEPVVVKRTQFFHADQVEEVFSMSKGTREIGPLRPGSESVGRKKFRSVRYEVYRASDFIFQPKFKTDRKVNPARTVDVLDAVIKLTSTANKYDLAATGARQRKDHKRARGFLKRKNNLLILAEVGLRRAINEELVKYVGSKRKVHFYVGDGTIFESIVAPPDWMMDSDPPSNVAKTLKENKLVYLVPQSNTKSTDKGPGGGKCRLMDAVWTVEQFKHDPTLDW